MWAYPCFLKRSILCNLPILILGKYRRNFKEGLRCLKLNFGANLLHSVRKSSWIVTREIGHYPPCASGASKKHKVIVGDFEVIIGEFGRKGDSTVI